MVVMIFCQKFRCCNIVNVLSFDLQSKLVFFVKNYLKMFDLIRNLMRLQNLNFYLLIFIFFEEKDK